jgi:hypothetical protein
MPGCSGAERRKVGNRIVPHADSAALAIVATVAAANAPGPPLREPPELLSAGRVAGEPPSGALRARAGNTSTATAIGELRHVRAGPRSPANFNSRSLRPLVRIGVRRAPRPVTAARRFRYATLHDIPAVATVCEASPALVRS